MKPLTAEAKTGENTAPEPRPSNFLRDRIAEDIKTNKYDGRVQTRFPPEPNGYLHIGHAKAICLDFGLANEFGGHTNLRFDDTNPEKEEVEYVDSIMADVKWLGFQWDGLFYASDEENLVLFERMGAGEFPDGSRTLRAKIDMASPNINLRDPVMYRILHADHHRTGGKWCIYPMYD